MTHEIRQIKKHERDFVAVTFRQFLRGRGYVKLQPLYGGLNYKEW